MFPPLAVGMRVRQGEIFSASETSVSFLLRHLVIQVAYCVAAVGWSWDSLVPAPGNWEEEELNTFQRTY